MRFKTHHSEDVTVTVLNKRGCLPAIKQEPVKLKPKQPVYASGRLRESAKPVSQDRLAHVSRRAFQASGGRRKYLSRAGGIKAKHRNKEVRNQKMCWKDFQPHVCVWSGQSRTESYLVVLFCLGLLFFFSVCLLFSRDSNSMKVIFLLKSV